MTILCYFVDCQNYHTIALIALFIYTGSGIISFIDCQAASTALEKYQRITDRACRDTKKEHLETILFELKDRVKNDASVFTKFVDILREKFKRNVLADKLMSECTKV